MEKISTNKLLKFLNSASQEDNSYKRGKALEDLICYLFAKIPGISIAMRNELNESKSEEIDVAFWNEKVESGLLFLPEVILVESKNWSEPVSSKEVASFDTKLRNRGLLMGILVATNGVTGNRLDRSESLNIITSALREQRRIIVFNKQEILSFQSTEQIIKSFKIKYCQLAVTGTSF